MRKNKKAAKKTNNTIENEFGNFERFKKEFSQAALSVEGSGWAALAFEHNKLARGGKKIWRLSCFVVYVKSALKTMLQQKKARWSDEKCGCFI